ncbi:MAG: DNA translocase FtsK 4TM domain-containing protein [Sphingomonadaceae bacterium]|nr:DNA translocase FtsK 4TM domain-containing protein [Sphingomonadaceae bacterium]
MATNVMARVPAWRDGVRRGALRGRDALTGVGLIVLALFLATALISYHVSDPALNTAAAGPPRNIAGMPGAWIADLLLSLFGPLAGLFVPLILLAGVRRTRGADAGRWGRATFLLLVACLLGGTALAVHFNAASMKMPAGWGGLLGLAGGAVADYGLGFVSNVSILHWVRLVLTLALGAGGLWFAVGGLRPHFAESGWLGRRRGTSVRISRARKAPGLDRSARAVGPLTAVEPELDEVTAESARPAPIITERQRPNLGGKRSERERQRQFELGDSYVLPTLDLLSQPPKRNGQALDKAALERNARLLEHVLEDFHVKGQVVEVRPGPVVTMYELEPASGIKASRVIALADDIARNMSALSARVATIPGRSVIGIELPNRDRESVVLSELIGSESFEDKAAQLPLILGKNIAGDPVVADLAPMPHLLVAGTTGSGKSVGLNCMILSLLYRLTPLQCRMIMIDPKMLELSIYDDIPHLLSPVVTEPSKAVRALKWAVEQMEERYRMMASVGVRGLSSFNDKVRAAKAKGQPLGRKVQTGYDAESGQPIYEEEQLEYDVLPQIVIVVDELADLMMTAGKEVEFLIQRLAQKARAAGIHLIMATQRPSVDVITGVIKANLPTRISFHVTSKIDSRTILGEQGAEQLLGKGDMLYMPGGRGLARVHGPFVGDDEVRAVADHWRAQGVPDYVTAVTEEPEDGGFALDGAPPSDDSPEEQLYRKAVQIVAESQKASTSYVQRQLRVGYNSAARLIERMEKEGVVGSPDHVGRREVLIDREGHAI